MIPKNDYAAPIISIAEGGPTNALTTSMNAKNISKNNAAVETEMISYRQLEERLQLKVFGRKRLEPNSGKQEVMDNTSPASTATTTTMTPNWSTTSPLVSMGSETSVSSIDTDDSTTNTTNSLKRRKIFAHYWQKNPRVGEEQQQPQSPALPSSPLIEHYPSSKSSNNCPANRSPTTVILEQDEMMTTNSPIPRRSIFDHIIKEPPPNSSEGSLDQYFSQHKHMTVLFSTLSTNDGNDDNNNESSSSSFALQQKHRPRSQSCPDQGSSKQPSLPSCLKRNSYGSEQDFSVHRPRRDRPSMVTFDCQIEVVAFSKDEDDDNNNNDNMEEDFGLDHRQRRPSWEDLFQG